MNLLDFLTLTTTRRLALIICILSSSVAWVLLDYSADIGDEPMTRKERVERMLHELRYEIEVGMMQGDIDETLGFEFVVPVSKSIPDGVVMCSFRTRPVHRLYHQPLEPRLRIVK